MAKIRYVLKGDLGFVESFDFNGSFSIYYAEDIESSLLLSKKKANLILSRYSLLTRIPVKVDKGVISLADKSDIELFSHGSRISRLEKEISELRRLLLDLTQREIHHILHSPTSPNP